MLSGKPGKADKYPDTKRGEEFILEKDDCCLTTSLTHSTIKPKRNKKEDLRKGVPSELDCIVRRRARGHSLVTIVIVIVSVTKQLSDFFFSFPLSFSVLFPFFSSQKVKNVFLLNEKKQVKKAQKRLKIENKKWKRKERIEKKR